MKIAICDDSYTTQSELEELVWESFQGNKGELECDVFSSGNGDRKYGTAAFTGTISDLYP